MNPNTDIFKDNNKAQPLVFRGANFDIFKVRIQAKLRSKGLWKVVNGDEQRDDDDDEDYDSEEEDEFDLLVNSPDDDNLAYLHTKVYVTGSSMQKQITELRILQQKLLLMGSRVDDDMLGRVLLTSAKEAYPTKFKKRDLAKGNRGKCLPTPEDHEVNILDDIDQGFILATTQIFIDFSDGWILDSACTADVTGDKTKFKKLSRCGHVTLSLVDNSTVTVTHSGALAIQVDETYRLERASAKYVASVTKNLCPFVSS
ncbi:hypothetical protein DYB34_011872 [Aphanomyces astaci]|uniref:Retrovirus-related Pol polyprotein from transposon TNT 1-94-like beta-barrel domain-containing protein n=1 Tax=Aphanomyces astaci TaxID=112090 RepID=A0A418BP42_APHAT|nr:hypothetical protein DYB34_011872 [Aphanomyces astaci]